MSKKHGVEKISNVYWTDARYSFSKVFLCPQGEHLQCLWEKNMSSFVHKHFTRTYFLFFQQTSDVFTNGCMVTITQNWGIHLINQVTWLCVIVMIQWWVKTSGVCWKKRKYVLVYVCAQNWTYSFLTNAKDVLPQDTEKDWRKYILHLFGRHCQFLAPCFYSCFCHKQSR